MSLAIKFAQLAAEQQAFPSHEGAIGCDPPIGVAVHAGRRHDGEVFRVCRRDGQLRNLRLSAHQRLPRQNHRNENKMSQNSLLKHLKIVRDTTGLCNKNSELRGLKDSA